MWSALTFLIFSNRLQTHKFLYWTVLYFLVFKNMILWSWNSFSGVSLNSYLLGVDQLNLIFILLTLMIIYMILTLMKEWSYGFMFYLLLGGVYLFFFSKKMIFFYIFFELSIMPMFLMILQWGSKPERLKAGMYMIIYTLVGSLPLLFSFVLLFQFLDKGIFFPTSMFKIVQQSSMEECLAFYDMVWWVSYNYSVVWFIFLMSMGFLMKLPLFGVHLWLPKAHVEATTEGSMILASVLLKLGVFGILRISSMVVVNFKIKLSILFSWMSMGVLVVSLICFRNIDLKMLMAYSSVVHMLMVVYVGYLSLMNKSFSCLLISVGHGICSSLLFYFMGFWYKESKSRKILLKNSLLLIFPAMNFCWVGCLFLKSKMPPTMKFFGELMVFFSVQYFSSWVSWFIIFTVFLGGLFKIYLYMGSSHGLVKLNVNLFLNMKTFIFLVIVLHLILKMVIVFYWPMMIV